MKRHGMTTAAVAMVLLVLGWSVAGCSSDRILGPVAGGCEERGPLYGSNASFPAWHPSGRWIACMNATDEHGAFYPGLYVVDTNFGRATRLVSEDSLGIYGAWWIQWSPDGSRLLFWTDRRIVYRDFRDETWHLVNDLTHDENYPFWSPGGDSIFLVRTSRQYDEPDTTMGLYVVDLRSGLLHRFVCSDGLMTVPDDRAAFSPDRRWIAYTDASVVGTGIVREIYVVRADGSERRRVTHLGGEAGNPQWISADEVEFDYVPYACQGYRAMRHTWSVRIDGSGLRRWTRDLVDNRVQFGWLPAISPTLTEVATVEMNRGLGDIYIGPLSGVVKRRLFIRGGAW